MAQTVAFLIPCQADDAVRSFKDVAATAGYGVAEGLKLGDPEVVDGIRAFCRFQAKPLEVFYLISTPENGDAFDIYQEVLFAASKPVMPRFYGFLEALGSIPGSRPEYMVACTEWGAEDEAVWLEGSPANLVSYLKVVNTLGLMLWSPHTGRTQDSDRYPIVFRFI